jgi:exonuclease SbcC
MKTSIKAMVALFMAALVWTGCIDTAVSEEVKDLRSAQAQWVAAKAALAAAQAEQQTILNTHTAAMNAIELQAETAGLAETLAEINTAVREAEAQLAQADLNLANAIDAYNKYIQEQGLTEAAEYLATYGDAVADLNDLLAEKVQAEARIAEAEAILASPTATWVVERELLEGTLADLQARLVANEAALESFLAVQADPTIAAQLAADLRGENQELENANASLEIELEQANQAQIEADEDYNDANDLISDYEDLQDDLESYQDDLEDYQDDLADAQADLAADQAELADETEDLEAMEAAAAPLIAAVEAAQALEDAQEEVVEDLEVARDVAQAELDAADANFDPGDDEYDDALAARDDAQDALDDANADLGDLITARIEAENAWNNSGLESDIDNQEMTLFFIGLDIEQDMINIENAEENIVFVTEDITDTENDIAAIQTAYDDASANIGALYAETLATDNAYDAIDNEIEANDDMIDANEAVIDVILDEIENLNEEIEGAREDIADIKDSIQGVQESLLAEAINEAAQADLLATLESDLVRINAQITAQQAFVAAVKALLDAALA